MKLYVVSFCTVALSLLIVFCVCA